MITRMRITLDSERDERRNIVGRLSDRVKESVTVAKKPSASAS